MNNCYCFKYFNCITYFHFLCLEHTTFYFLTGTLDWVGSHRPRERRDRHCTRLVLLALQNVESAENQPHRQGSHAQVVITVAGLQLIHRVVKAVLYYNESAEGLPT